MKPTEKPENDGIPPVAAEAPKLGEKLPDFSFTKCLQNTDVQIASAELDTSDTGKTPKEFAALIAEDSTDAMIVETETASNTEDAPFAVPHEAVSVPFEKHSSQKEDAHSTEKVTKHTDTSNEKKSGEPSDVSVKDNLPETTSVTYKLDFYKTRRVSIEKDIPSSIKDTIPHPPPGEEFYLRPIDLNPRNVSSAGESSGTGILSTVKSSTRVVKKEAHVEDDMSDDGSAPEAGPSSSTAKQRRGRPRKRARLTMPRPTPKKKKVEESSVAAAVVEEEEAPDRQAYEVERIISIRLKGKQLFYYMKWKDYPEEDNTFEPETRTDCEHLMHDFILDRIDPSEYVNCLQKILDDITNGGNMEFLVVVVPLSAIGLTTVQTGTAKAVSHDSVYARLSYLKYVNIYQQQYTLYALKMPTSAQLSEYHKKYLQQLRFRFETFPEHPTVEIVMPRELHELKGLYPPPPIYTLLFEPVSEEMFEERVKNPHMFPPKSEERAYNKSQVFAKEHIFKPNSDDEDPRMNPEVIGRMPRRDFESDPRFAVNLRLHQETPRGWILSAGHDVKPYTPLLMMTGVIRPYDVAHECLEEYGEAVAFSSFVEIPNTGMCLDRRQFYDFSKFISHSCTPTCSVRLVESGNEIPDLVVYNVVPLERFNNRNITLDYYKAFTADVKAFFRGLGDSEVDSCPLLERNIDFMKCQCLSQSCRGVLYVDKSKKRAIKSANKRQKLSALDQDFAFHGSQLADPNKIWTIQNYKFQN